MSPPDDSTSAPEDLGAIIHRVQSRFIRSAEAHEVFDALMPELLTLTASEYGFVGHAPCARNHPGIELASDSNSTWRRSGLDMASPGKNVGGRECAPAHRAEPRDKPESLKRR